MNAIQAINREIRSRPEAGEGELPAPGEAEAVDHSIGGAADECAAEAIKRDGERLPRIHQLRRGRRPPLALEGVRPERDDGHTVVTSVAEEQVAPADCNPVRVLQMRSDREARDLDETTGARVEPLELACGEVEEVDP